MSLFLLLIIGRIGHVSVLQEMEEQFNKETEEGWRLAADAVRITDERAGSEDPKHTSGGVFVAAVDSNLGERRRGD